MTEALATTAAPAGGPERRRSTATRLADTAAKAARAAIATITRQQATPNMPRIAAPGTLLGIHLDTPPTQRRAPLTTAARRKAAALSLTDFFSGAGGSSLGALGAGIGDIRAYNHWPEAVACHAVNIGGAHFVTGLSMVADLADAGVLAGPGAGDPAHVELFGPIDLFWLVH